MIEASKPEAPPPGASRDGLVEFVGAQSAIFKTGKAGAAVSLDALKQWPSLYALGPVKDLDGEITIIDSKPYVSRVKGTSFSVDHSWGTEAIFLSWTRQAAWRDVAVPRGVSGYLDLQEFVKAAAATAGLDTARPFPFLLVGAPAEIKWHINVDRTEGRPIDEALFAKSKASYVLKNEPVEIIGFYSERHAGVFVSRYAPAVPPESGRTNAIHIHFVSKASSATGHIDDITLAEGMTLRLPDRR